MPTDGQLLMHKDDATVTDLNSSTPATRFPAILLFGMPGVGKGTQGSLLGSMRGVFHVSTGAIFRDLDPATSDGHAVHSRIDHGEYVPDELALRLWRKWLGERVRLGAYSPTEDVLVLDGIPRSVRQCELLEAHIEVLLVLHLEATDIAPLIERLSERAIREGRPDDANLEIIQRRFEIYRETTHPLLNYYPTSLLRRIDPLGSPMQVAKRILEVVAPVLQRSNRVD